MRAIREDGRTIHVENCDERVAEFKRRLIHKVAEICCDVKDRAPSGQSWNEYMNELSADELKTLCDCFRKELKQVIFAIKEAK
jgi:hypothetical protein